MDVKVRVVGLGNVLVGDDAFGPWVIHALGALWSFPDEVSLEDLGTPGLDLLPYLTDVDTVILVDTVRSDGAPGDLRRYDKAQILARPLQPRVSPHDPGVKDALLSLDLEGRGPREVILVGAIPGETRYDVGMSPALRAAVEPAARRVVEELAALGFVIRRRAGAVVPDPWWDRKD